MPRASSGSFFAPNKTRIISRMTIKSGPAKFMKLARKLITNRSIRLFAQVARQFSNKQPIATGAISSRGRRVDIARLLCERRDSQPYASHLERQHQLRAGLYSGGGLPGHA